MDIEKLTSLARIESTVAAEVQVKGASAGVLECSRFRQQFIQSQEASDISWPL